MAAVPLGKKRAKTSPPASNSISLVLVLDISLVGSMNESETSRQSMWSARESSRGGGTDVAETRRRFLTLDTVPQRREVGLSCCLPSRPLCNLGQSLHLRVDRTPS